METPLSGRVGEGEGLPSPSPAVKGLSHPAPVSLHILNLSQVWTKAALSAAQSGLWPFQNLFARPGTNSASVSPGRWLWALVPTQQTSASTSPMQSSDRPLMAGRGVQSADQLHQSVCTHWKTGLGAASPWP